MYVKLKTIMAGPDVSGQPGQILQVPDDRGALLIKGGFAEPSGPPAMAEEPLTREEIKRLRAIAAREKGVETAEAPASEEVADAPAGKGRRR